MPFFKLPTRFAGRLVLLSGLLTAGCTTHSRNAGMAVSQLKTGNTASALKWSEELKESSRNRELGYLESGRIKMLSGDFAGSRMDFASAIDTVLEETENGPALRAGAVGTALAASTLADDTVRKYELPPYEIIQMMHYQTLNYLFIGDPDGAAVEMRRTVFAQDAIAEKYSKEISKAQELAAASREAVSAVQTRMQTLEPVLERTRSSYENGLAWYFCGLIFEKQGDAANSALCYRKAAELSPGNSCVQKDFMRMLRTQDPQRFAELSGPDHAGGSLTRSGTEIVVLYEEAMISQRQAEKIPVPVPDFRGAVTLISIDFPFYRDTPYMPQPLTVSEGTAVYGVTEPSVFLQSLAYQDLKDKMPGIVVRNVTRAAAKVVAQQIANNQNDDLMRFGMMAISAATSIASTSDTRAWYSIPMVTHVYRGPIAAGQHLLQFRTARGTGFTVPVAVADGETRLIWIADTGGIAVAATASLSGKGAPPAYQQFNNPFWTNAPGSAINTGGNTMGM